ncbi:hypothetical protein [Kribbella solani]|uniref:Uncharacterized protein n=1 Tax=Kribbella solani TaxID=236067 RepID=A0A841DM26_9ACTN|nr:hypothetical protein [Kribbella solani]MBB5979713.1 hypothetical protein [Kribbella solani]
MGTTGDSGAAKGRSGPPTPAVVGTGRNMRARDVSRPSRPVQRRPVLPPDEPDSQDGPGDGQGSGGSSPVDS